MDTELSVVDSIRERKINSTSNEVAGDVFSAGIERSTNKKLARTIHRFIALNVEDITERSISKVWGYETSGAEYSDVEKQ